MSPNGLRDFLHGATPRSANRVKLERWLAAQGQISRPPNVGQFVRLLNELAVDLSPKQALELGRSLAGLLVESYEMRRLSPPRWVRDLLRQYESRSANKRATWPDPAAAGCDARAPRYILCAVSAVSFSCGETTMAPRPAKTKRRATLSSPKAAEIVSLVEDLSSGLGTRDGVVVGRGLARLLAEAYEARGRSVPAWVVQLRDYYRRRRTPSPSEPS